MPSHIFVHLGMWPEAAASNESSWAASQSWIAKTKRDASFGDFHSLSWLQAIHRARISARRRTRCSSARACVGRSKEEREWMRVTYARMVTKNVVESEDWARLDEKLAPLTARMRP